MDIDASDIVDPFLFFDRADLPWFVDYEKSDFFAVQSVGDMKLDQDMGVWVADEAMAYARRHRNSAVIAFALQSIAERKAIGNLEAGFITRIASAVMVASMN